MEDIVLSRLRDVCPLQKLSEMDIVEIEKSCHVAFDVIGYNPVNFKQSFDKVWKTTDAEYLSDFIYEVWGNDE